MDTRQQLVSFLGFTVLLLLIGFSVQALVERMPAGSLKPAAIGALLHPSSAVAAESLSACGATTACGSPCSYGTEAYPTKMLAGLCWMTKNLNTTTASDGKTAIGRQCYLGNTGDCQNYGGLYTWSDAQVACPSGWHLPTETEWATYSSSYSPDQLMSGATDNFGAIRGGGKGSDGRSFGLDDYSYYWSSTRDGSSRSFYRFFTGGATLHEGSNTLDTSYAVRCVKD